MKTLTQAEATPGEWNFISQGLFPIDGARGLLTNGTQ